MGHLRARELLVEFPIYGAKSRSLKRTVMQAATGGRLATEADHVVVRALEGVSFDVREGERVGLYGHNGSGKTTLLRVLSGAYEPVGGTLEVGGHVTSMLSIALGMDQDSTGVENIYLRGAVMGLRRKAIDAMVEDIAEFAELGDYIDMPMRTYSSGMAMRLAFAISTAVSADIVLMDEWLSVGDQEFSVKAELRLTRVLSNARILVVASHSLDFLLRSCTRILKLEHGKIAGDWPADQARVLLGAAASTSELAQDGAEPRPVPMDCYLGAVEGANIVSGRAAATYPERWEGQLVAFVPPESNTGDVTLEVSGLGAKPLYYRGWPLKPGMLQQGRPVVAEYREERYELLPQEVLTRGSMPARLLTMVQQALSDLSARTILEGPGAIQHELATLGSYMTFIQQLQIR